MITIKTGHCNAGPWFYTLKVISWFVLMTFSVVTNGLIIFFLLQDYQPQVPQDV